MVGPGNVAVSRTKCMIWKSGNRFSEKIMLSQRDETMIRLNPIGS